MTLDPISDVSRGTGSWLIVKQTGEGTEAILEGSSHRGAPPPSWACRKQSVVWSFTMPVACMWA